MAARRWRSAVPPSTAPRSTSRPGISPSQAARSVMPGEWRLPRSSSLSGWGSVAGSLSGNGTVTASGGTLDLIGSINGPQLLIATAAGSDLKIDGTATPAGAIAISSANQTLEIGAAGNLSIGAAETVSAGHIQLDGGSLADASGIALSAGATLSGKGTVSAAVSGAGTITANGGILEFKNAVDGSGTA